MIGQTELRKFMEDLFLTKKFPRFAIIVGDVGSGKKTLVDYIYHFYSGCTFKYQLPDIKVETVRKMVTDSYKIKEPTMYMIFDVDNMSIAAKNALLKITEEPPNDAYFVITVADLSTIPDTLISRATIFYMDRYTSEEIHKYATTKFKNELSYDALELCVNVCETPGEVDLLQAQDPIAFYDYVKLVIDYIDTASDANVFKLGNKIALKSGADGYDLRLFWKLFVLALIDETKLEIDPIKILKNCTGSTITGKYLSQLGIRGINKQMLLDKWIIDMREASR